MPSHTSKLTSLRSYAAATGSKSAHRALNKGLRHAGKVRVWDVESDELAADAIEAEIAYRDRIWSEYNDDRDETERDLWADHLQACGLDPQLAYTAREVDAPALCVPAEAPHENYPRSFDWWDDELYERGVDAEISSQREAAYYEGLGDAANITHSQYE